MKNKTTKNATVITDLEEQQQISAYFSYLSCLVTPDATILGNLQLFSPKELETDPQELDVALARRLY